MHQRGDFDSADHLDEMLLKARTIWNDRTPEFEKWIENCPAADFTIHNIPKYRECVEDVADWFEQRSWQRASVSAYREL